MKLLKASTTLACALVGTALVSEPALADPNVLLPSQIGGPVCMSQAPAASAPGLFGTPTWPDTQFIAPSGQVRGDVQEPRWSNAPLRSFIYRQDPTAGFARYRLLYDPVADDLIVSIQVMSDANAASASDKVHFGIANAEGTTAYGVEIPVIGADDPATPETETATGRYIRPIASGVRNFTFASGSWGATAGQGLPGWVEDAAIWNVAAEQGDNGAAWVVQFRVDLTDVGLEGGGSPARVNLGAIVHVPGTGALGRAISHTLPNTYNGCDGPCNKNGPFFLFPAQWTPTEVLNAPCADGISIQPEDIGTDHPDGSNRVRTPATLANQFKIFPDFDGLELETGNVHARLRISNWGTVPMSQTAWTALQNGAAPFTTSADLYNNFAIDSDGLDASDNPYSLDYQCTNSGTDPMSVAQRNVCGLNLNLDDHQCILVDLRAADGLELPFERAAAWKNTRWVTASEVNESATISVRGLAAQLGNNNTRDVYLHVVTTNMPAAGTVPMEEDVEGQESLREQVDPFFEAGLYCGNRRDICLPIDAEDPSDGSCIYEGDVEFGCGYDEPLGDSGYCVRAESCYVPDGFVSYSPALTAMDKSQLLASVVPTIMIYPYYESTQTIAVNGQALRTLVPMYPFGLHVKHEDEYFGWLHGLTGPGLTQLAPNYYHVRIPSEQSIKINVRVSAEEQKHYQPYSQIAGVATNLGFNIDTINLTGVIGNQPMDFSRATATVQNLLQHNQTELTSNLNGPRTLTRLAGATPLGGVFASVGPGAAITMEVINLPLIGRTVNITVVGATVRRPSTCGFFGTAQLSTQFSLSDGINPALEVRGTDQWSCVPTSMFNY